jgi:hypothetical protein
MFDTLISASLAVTAGFAIFSNVYGWRILLRRPF